MKILYVYLKQVPALLADFANGIFATLLAALITGEEVLWWYFLIGIPLAMLPDLDAIPELFAKGSIGATSDHNHDHRELLHHPLLFFILGAVSGAMFGYWGWVFLFATMLHFVNDLYGTGWGIALFWPFSKDRYKFFTDEDNEMSFGWADLLRRLPIQELPTRIESHGNENWLADSYYRVSTVATIEYSIFLLAVVLMALSLS